MLFAAAIHDYEHTGTTNTFHVQTRSNLGTYQLLKILCTVKNQIKLPTLLHFF